MCRTADGACWWLAADGNCSFPYCRFARASIIWSMLERGSGVGKPSITSCWPAAYRRVHAIILWDSWYCVYTNFMLTSVPWWSTFLQSMHTQLKSLYFFSPLPLTCPDDCRCLTTAQPPILCQWNLVSDHQLRSCVSASLAYTRVPAWWCNNFVVLLATTAPTFCVLLHFECIHCSMKYNEILQYFV